VNIALGLIPLSLLMWAVTYPSRALPMLAPGIERLPNWAISYLRLAGPAALAALAATGCLLTSDSPPHLQLGAVPIAVAVCVLITWKTRQLLLGVGAAVILVAVARAAGAA
jgi:branched-subunit amino acid transport protein